MAKVAFLLVAQPNEPTALTTAFFDLARSLAESQHEVQIIGSHLLQPPEHWTHSRLSYIQPVRNWKIWDAPKLLFALTRFQPQVLHVALLSPLTRLSLLPVLASACQNVLQAPLVVSDASGDPRHTIWIKEADWSSPAHFHVRLRSQSATHPQSPNGWRVVLPPPTAQLDMDIFLERLSDQLSRHPDVTAIWLRSWSDLPVKLRHRWRQRLHELNLNQRLVLSGGLSDNEQMDILRSANCLSLAGVTYGSPWYQIALLLAEESGLPLALRDPSAKFPAEFVVGNDFWPSWLTGQWPAAVTRWRERIHNQSDRALQDSALNEISRIYRRLRIGMA